METEFIDLYFYSTQNIIESHNFANTQWIAEQIIKYVI